MEANRERDREDLKEMMEQMIAKMDANQAEMRSIICTLGTELKETIQREMRGAMHSESKRKLTAACRKVSRRAKVAWRQRKLVRKFATQENCGPRKSSPLSE
jgi:hypothetical protein